jgi:hypothetical protein
MAGRSRSIRSTERLRRRNGQRPKAVSRTRCSVKRCATNAGSRFFFSALPSPPAGEGKGGEPGSPITAHHFVLRCDPTQVRAMRKRTPTCPGAWLDRSRLEQRQGDGGVVRARGRQGIGRRPRSRRGAGDANGHRGRGRRAHRRCVHRFGSRCDGSGRIGVQFNNVGMQVIGGPLEVKEEHWDRLMTVNVRSMYLTCRAP